MLPGWWVGLVWELGLPSIPPLYHHRTRSSPVPRNQAPHNLPTIPPPLTSIPLQDEKLLIRRNCSVGVHAAEYVELEMSTILVRTHACGVLFISYRKIECT